MQLHRMRAFDKPRGRIARVDRRGFVLNILDPAALVVSSGRALLRQGNGTRPATAEELVLAKRGSRAVRDLLVAQGRAA